MRAIRPLWIWVGLICLAGSCIFPFDPEIGSVGTSLVINGRVSDQEGWHYVEISRSSAVNSAGGYLPVSGYTVEIHDDLGNVFNCSEVEPGKYGCMITQDFLVPGIRFKLMVTSEAGKRYESAFDELLPCPPVQDITYEAREQLTPDPDINYNGAQFFVSTDASGGNYAKNYLWELEETWQYHSQFLTRDYYDGEIHLEEVGTDSIYYCYDSRSIPEIYVYSTRDLNSGLIRNFPLHYITDRTYKLSVKYSLLVRQSSLSEPAYDYWKTLEQQSKQNGDLYETQPGAIPGNIHSVDDPDESILGLFYATCINEKRAFFRPNIPGIGIACFPEGFSQEELLFYLEGFDTTSHPIYLIRVTVTTADYADPRCFDCRLQGGTLEVPEFWNDEFDFEVFE